MTDPMPPAGRVPDVLGDRLRELRADIFDRWTTVYEEARNDPKRRDERIKLQGRHAGLCHAFDEFEKLLRSAAAPLPLPAEEEQPDRDAEVRRQFEQLRAELNAEMAKPPEPLCQECDMPEAMLHHDLTSGAKGAHRFVAPSTVLEPPAPAEERCAQQDPPGWRCGAPPSDPIHSATSPNVYRHPFHPFVAAPVPPVAPNAEDGR